MLPRVGGRRSGWLRGGGLALCLWLAGCVHGGSLKPGEAQTVPERSAAIRQARVWFPVDVAARDLKAGPAMAGAFASDAWVDCVYSDKKASSGRSAKFTCETSPGHEVKVKYGAWNAEVFGEVLATRLFWALGFPADASYPVRVRCKGCPADPRFSPEILGPVAEFDPAAIERKLPGRPMETRPDSGWEWKELEDIGPEAGPNARAERDALKLLVAFVQHTDSKAPNQRLLCPQGEELGQRGCRAPVLMVNDLGLTFGHAGLANKNVDSVSLATWAPLPVWNDDEGCVAKLRGSFTGSLSYPKISEAGRALLAGLLVQLSDRQLVDLFETARVERRSSEPRTTGPAGSVDGWVAAFKAKRAQVVDRRCKE